MHLARGRNTSSFGFFLLRSSNYKGRASFLPIRRRKCRRSEWKSRCFNVHSLSFPLASPFGGWKQIILLELPPSSWSVIGLVPRHGHNSLSLFLSFDRYCRSFLSISSGTNHNWAGFFFFLEKSVFEIETTNNFDRIAWF